MKQYDGKGTEGRRRPRGYAHAPLLALLLIAGCAAAPPHTPQEHVHHMGGQVMPFDLARTVHIFRMTETGGIQRVVTRDAGASDQVPAIQRHLQHEAHAFQRGDYADPAALHGAHMPGLKELQAGAAQVKVVYSPLPDGAEIRFETTDLALLTAIHRWFGAQLSEHGADARAE